MRYAQLLHFHLLHTFIHLLVPSGRHHVAVALPEVGGIVLGLDLTQARQILAKDGGKGSNVALHVAVERVRGIGDVELA